MNVTFRKSIPLVQIKADLDAPGKSKETINSNDRSTVVDDGDISMRIRNARDISNSNHNDENGIQDKDDDDEYDNESLHVLESDVIWSTGKGVHNRIIKKSFHQSSRVKGAVITRFFKIKDSKFVCVLCSGGESVKLYSSGGAEYEVALPCKASGIWSIPGGIMIQREIDQELKNELLDNQTSPIFFTLTHPLDEMKPVSVLEKGNGVSGVSNNNNYSNFNLIGKSLRSSLLNPTPVKRALFAEDVEDDAMGHGMRDDFKGNEFFEEQFITNPYERIMFSHKVLGVAVTYNLHSQVHSIWNLLSKQEVAQMQLPKAEHSDMDVDSSMAMNNMTMNSMAHISSSSIREHSILAKSSVLLEAVDPKDRPVSFSTLSQKQVSAIDKRLSAMLSTNHEADYARTLNPDHPFLDTSIASHHSQNRNSRGLKNLLSARDDGVHLHNAPHLEKLLNSFSKEPFAEDQIQSIFGMENDDTSIESEFYFNLVHQHQSIEPCSKAFIAHDVDGNIVIYLHFRSSSKLVGFVVSSEIKDERISIVKLLKQFDVPGISDAQPIKALFGAPVDNNISIFDTIILESNYSGSSDSAEVCIFRGDIKLCNLEIQNNLGKPLTNNIFPKRLISGGGGNRDCIAIEFEDLSRADFMIQSSFLSPLVCKCFDALYRNRSIPRDIILRLQIDVLLIRETIYSHEQNGSKDSPLYQAYKEFQDHGLGSSLNDLDWISFSIAFSILVCNLDSKMIQDLIKSDSTSTTKASTNSASSSWDELLNSSKVPHQQYESIFGQRIFPNSKQEIKTTGVLPWWRRLIVQYDLLHSSMHLSSQEFTKHILHIIASLGLVFEDIKLNTFEWKYLIPIGEFVAGISSTYGMLKIKDYFLRELGCADTDVISFPRVDSMNPNFDIEPYNFFQWIQKNIIRNEHDEEIKMDTFYETILLPKRLRQVQSVMSVFFLGEIKPKKENDDFNQWIAYHNFISGNDSTAKEAQDINRSQLVVLSMVWNGLTSQDLESIPFGVSLILREALFRCRENLPGMRLPPDAYLLIGRQDIAALINNRFYAAIDDGESLSPTFGNENSNTNNVEEMDEIVGLPNSAGSIGNNSNATQQHRQNILATGFPRVFEISKLRFTSDKRLVEVCKLLSPSRLVSIIAEIKHESAESTVDTAQQQRLYELSLRTLASCVGRGALSLSTGDPLLAESMEAPKIVLQGKLPPNNAVIKLDMALVTVPPTFPNNLQTLELWPSFHNGASSGLRCRPFVPLQENVNQSAIHIDTNAISPSMARTWIIFNKPSTANFTHAGFLLGMGIQGYLNTLTSVDLYDLLSAGHDATSAAVILGAGIAKRGSNDPTLSKMLLLHIPSLFPSTFSELEVPSIVSTAAISGIGFLYMGSAPPAIADFLLKEIGKRATNDRAINRESYSLSAGFSLGLVALGKGSVKDGLAGLADLNIEDRLHKYIVGGIEYQHTKGNFSFSNANTNARSRVGTSGAGNHAGDIQGQGLGVDEFGGTSETNQSSCSRIYEGPEVNVSITAPGAIMALSMIFLKSENEAVSKRLSIPDTLFLLDYVRPDLLLLRVLAKNLIMWNLVKPTDAWVLQQVPPVIVDVVSNAEKRIGSMSYSDIRYVKQCHAYIIAGACFSLGFRYAGTGSPVVSSLLIKYAKVFSRELSETRKFANTVRAMLHVDIASLQMCVGVIAMSLGLVMAGTGDATALKHLRTLRSHVGPHMNYGYHMSISMSIGLLFLAAGRSSISTSNEAIAYLLMSLYPRFPIHADDNQYHLQALRHVYILAAESRCVEAFDVGIRRPCQIPLEIKLNPKSVDEIHPNARKGENDGDLVIDLIAPALLPPLHWIESIRVKSPQYWKYDITIDELRTLALSQSNYYRYLTLFVKKKTGQLSYSRDPHGIRSSLLSRPLPDIRTCSMQDLITFFESFTDDPYIMSFTRHICGLISDHVTTEENQEIIHFVEFASDALYYCLCQETPEILEILIQLFFFCRKSSLEGGDDYQVVPQSIQQIKNFLLAKALYSSQDKSKNILSVHRILDTDVQKYYDPLIKTNLLISIETLLQRKFGKSQVPIGESIKAYARGDFAALFKSKKDLQLTSQMLVLLSIPLNFELKNLQNKQ